MLIGRRNLITDVPGVLVGQASDQTYQTGVTVLTAEQPFCAAVHVMGGAPGTRETDLLAADKLVDRVDALVLSGGSALGLSAASAVTAALRQQQRGFSVGREQVPIVPAAIIFDLLTGKKISEPEQLYTQLGNQALGSCTESMTLGSVGAGTGATTANLKGGLGSASLVLPNQVTVGALAVVNAHGSAVHPENGRFWAAPYELDNEFGGFGAPPCYPTLQVPVSEKSAAFSAGSNTTIAIVATDVDLDKAQLLRVATAAHDGIARALVPSHTLLDGDLVFAVSTGQRSLQDEVGDAVLIGHAAALCLTRAIARGVHAATPHSEDALATWSERWQTTV